MGITIVDVLATILVHIVHCSSDDYFLHCDVASLDSCPDTNHVCNETSHQCYCREGFRKVEKSCVSANENDGSTGSATAVVVTIFALALVMCGLILVVRKYNLVDYVRQRINLRRNNDVMYEDVMIGQDDPPLSP